MVGPLVLDSFEQSKCESTVVIRDSHGRARTSAQKAGCVGSNRLSVFCADNRRNIVHALSAGDVRPDAIEKLLAATACGPEMKLVSMRFTLLNLRGNILAWPKSLESLTTQYLLTELPAQAEGRQSQAIRQWLVQQVHRFLPVNCLLGVSSL